jgi:hypothetical protein
MALPMVEMSEVFSKLHREIHLGDCHLLPGKRQQRLGQHCEVMDRKDTVRMEQIK